MSGPEDNFLGRWSRRKLAPEVRADAKTQAEAVEPDAVEPDAAQDPPLSDEQILAKLELPDPDLMKDGDDFAAFMSAAVPEHLRRKALRKLWLSNPALANLDGLVDYGEDYTDAANLTGTVTTAYKVGRGILSDILEDAPAEKSAQEAAPEVEDLTADLDDLDAGEAEAQPAQELYEPPEAEVEKHVVRPRMRFSTS